MNEKLRQLMVDERIACDGYPFSEAMYADVFAWENDTGLEWDKYVITRLLEENEELQKKVDTWEQFALDTVWGGKWW